MVHTTDLVLLTEDDINHVPDDWHVLTRGEYAALLGQPASSVPTSLGIHGLSFVPSELAMEIYVRLAHQLDRYEVDDICQAQLTQQ